MPSIKDWDDLHQWAEEIVAIGETMGRPLLPSERRAAFEVGVKNIADVRILEVDVIRKLPNSLLFYANKLLSPNGATGLTLDHVILIKKGSYTFKLLRHELRHVYQVEQYRDLREFLTIYVSQLIESGYNLAPMEIDARSKED